MAAFCPCSRVSIGSPHPGYPTPIIPRNGAGGGGGGGGVKEEGVDLQKGRSRWLSVKTVVVTAERGKGRQAPPEKASAEGTAWQARPLRRVRARADPRGEPGYQRFAVAKPHGSSERLLVNSRSTPKFSASLLLRLH